MMMGPGFLQNLVGGGCCCVQSETAATIVFNGTSESEPVGAVEPVEEEEESPFLTVTMQREKTVPIGLDVDMLDGVSLIVDKIKEGFVRTWNEAHPDMSLRVHDRIIEVNGTRFNAQALAAELHHATEWALKISRPNCISVSVEHETGATFGVDLRPQRNALLMSKIGDGFLRDWLAANPNMSVNEHDRIVQVDGISGNSHKLLRALHASQKSTTLKMEILSYDALPTHFEQFAVAARVRKGLQKSVGPGHIILDIVGELEKNSHISNDGEDATHPSFLDAAFLPEQERDQREEV